MSPSIRHLCVVCRRRDRATAPWDVVAQHGAVTRWACSEACRAAWAAAHACRVCGLPTYARGLCARHYHAAWRQRHGAAVRPYCTACQACGLVLAPRQRARGAGYRQGLCPACYERARRARKREAVA